MTGKRIAVISQRESVLRFLVAEIHRLGFSCICGASETADMKSCACFLIDAEQEAPRELPNGFTLLLSSQFSTVLQATEAAKVFRLSWPVSVRELNRFLTLSASSEANKVLLPSLTAEDAEASRDVLLYDDERVLVRNETVTLSATEHMLLLRLIQANGKAVSRDELSTLWSSDAENMADVYICHLRKKLEKPFSLRLIETVRGYGYRLCIPSERIGGKNHSEDI